MLSFQDGKKADKTDIYITISTFTSVRPYGVRRRPAASRPTSDFQIPAVV